MVDGCHSENGKITTTLDRPKDHSFLFSDKKNGWLGALTNALRTFPGKSLSRKDVSRKKTLCLNFSW